jgi:PKD repeat protein
VKLKVITALGSCVDSVIVPVDVIQSPSVSFTSSSACLGQEVEFFNSTIVPSGSANNYFWNFGDGSISTNDNPKHTFLGAGSYWVSLKAISSNGCADSMAVMKDVLLNAKADFESENICFGKQSHFRNLSAASGKALSFLWDFNNGVQSNTRDTAFVYANPGKYNVDLIVYGNDVCPDTASKEVEIFANPISLFTVSSGQKGDGTMSFIYNNHQAGNVYNWTFGDGNKSNDQNPIHSYLFDGVFNTCLTVTNSAGCVSVTCNDVSVFRTFVNKTEKSLIKLYPNPNHGELFISSDEVDLNGKHLKIRNALGQLVFEKILDSSQIQLQLSHLMKGVYVATISSGAVTEYTQKIVVQ